MSRPAGRCWRCGYLVTAPGHLNGCADLPHSGPDKAPKLGIGHGQRAGAGGLWPGITSGFDARCTCTWAPMAGVYQVKVRDALCLTHGGPLAGALTRVTGR